MVFRCSRMLRPKSLINVQQNQSFWRTDMQYRRYLAFTGFYGFLRSGCMVSKPTNPGSESDLRLSNRCSQADVWRFPCCLSLSYYYTEQYVVLSLWYPHTQSHQHHHHHLHHHASNDVIYDYTMQLLQPRPEV